MTDEPNDPQVTLACGDRVQICNNVLQAFYGRYGTVIDIRRCRHTGQVIHIVVQMDDLSVSEGYAMFTPAQLSLLPTS